MKQLWMIGLCLVLYACGAGTSIEHKPDISGVQDPIKLIKSTLEEQPSKYAYVPYEVEVNDQYIAFALGAGHRHPGTFTRLYYKRLGDIRLSKSWRYPTYEVNIWENTGDHAAIVVTLEEKQAKDFINALQYMKDSAVTGKLVNEHQQDTQGVSTSSKSEIEEKMEILRDLMKKGFITEEEYTRKKSLLLDKF